LRGRIPAYTGTAHRGFNVGSRHHKTRAYDRRLGADYLLERTAIRVILGGVWKRAVHEDTRMPKGTLPTEEK